jgi:hypothetical protein
MMSVVIFLLEFVFLVFLGLVVGVADERPEGLVERLVPL